MLLIIMILGILKEPAIDNRVSALPESVTQFISLGFDVLVEQQAGASSFASDASYKEAGAKVHSRSEIIDQADILLSINPTEDEIKNKTIIGTYFPINDFEMANKVAANNNILFSMDNIPRTTRAQSMDVLSSQANIAGYKSVLLAAANYSRYFPMFMTAAGSIRPAKVLILGAGVAGLQAIATARRLGSVVEVFDTRPAVKEEVKSLGAKFVEVEGAADASAAGGYAVEQSEEYKQKQTAMVAEHASKADIIITTAQIPGRQAPLLVTEETLSNMKSGSVVIDLAASTGGNCAKTENNKTILHDGITIIGDSNLASTMPSDASKLYGKNILNFLKLFFDKEGNFNMDFEDDLILGTCICKDGKIINERILNAMNK